ncbi:type 2 lanthipeptide synthetase LanM family protein [Nostoc sp. 106C]|uniref:type 2 lanthipeptide synthetase LanM family protein n=1 Tax=Nostoc sp. 106C TaxID=1932667 RepID=UPI000A381029|nr:type 2 lanthipeptide synthetase LanM family protein [Nostoc sp. 106C]OUL32375.1 hypothetical protein BV375_10025 [Nostoc sp. 106C]
MHISQEKLIEIVELASTFAEKITDDFIPVFNRENDSKINSIIGDWCQIIADGDQSVFEKRLAWDGLDLNKIRKAIASVKLNDNHTLPEWANTFYEGIKGVTYENKKEIFNNRFLSQQQPIPFEEVLLEFICVARRKLITQVSHSYYLLSDEAHTELERNLLELLSGICSPSLEFEFSVFCATRQSTVSRLSLKNSEDFSRLYQSFIKSLIQSELVTFFQEYPVLARLLGKLINLWVDSTVEFIKRLESDWDKIQNTFQSKLEKVVSIKPLGDRHHNGCSVMLVVFDSGLKIIYKPRDLEIYQAYYHLLEWLNHNSKFLIFKLIKILNCSEYGWVEFVESVHCKNIEELRHYYRRCGALLCLAYLLGATDLHYENIIVHGEQPVLVDLETLMHPKAQEVAEPGANKNAQYLAIEQISRSVLSTGLMPFVFKLEGELNQTGLPFYKWNNINNDNAVDASSIIGCKISNDLAHEFAEEIVEGFRQIYSFLVEHRESLLAPNSPLTYLAHQQVRFIFRHTATYSSILRKSLQPKYLCNGVIWSIQLDVLSKGMLLSHTKPYFWPLMMSEKQALEQLDIPVFTCSSDSIDLKLSSNQIIYNFFKESSFNFVISHFKHFNDEDLKLQIGFIQGLVYSSITTNYHESSIPGKIDNSFYTDASLTQSKITQQAIAIAVALQKQAISGTDGSVTWIAPQYDSETKQFLLKPLDYGLYAGTCGVALFLAALEKVTGGAGFRNLTLGALQSLREDIYKSVFTQIVKRIGIGAAEGCSSFIITLVRISHFLNEPVLLKDARKVASLITPELILADSKFDILYGSAGGILGLLALYNATADSELLEQAITCAHHLLNNRVVSDSNYKTWKTLDGNLLTGFSHGAAGIAYALLRLHQTCGEVAFLEAAYESISFENSIYIPEMGNWLPFKANSPEKDHSCMCSWCHGAPGIGLARVGGLEILDTFEIQQNIKAAIKTTKQHKLSEIDHLCCGNLGRIEFLFTAGKKLSQPQLVEAAIAQASQVVDRAKHRGTFGYSPLLGYNPGFFQGAAGIGYELLRLAYPDQLPSVLLWE